MGPGAINDLEMVMEKRLNEENNCHDYSVWEHGNFVKTMPVQSFDLGKPTGPFLLHNLLSAINAESLFLHLS